MKSDTFKVINLRLPVELAATLQEMARADARSLTNLVAVILRDYVENKRGVQK